MQIRKVNLSFTCVQSPEHLLHPAAKRMKLDQHLRRNVDFLQEFRVALYLKCWNVQVALVHWWDSVGGTIPEVLHSIDGAISAMLDSTEGEQAMPSPEFIIRILPQEA